MPRVSDEISICGRLNVACTSKVTKQIELQTNESFLCECLPGCFGISYDTEVSMAPLLQRSPILKERGLMTKNVAILHIFFKENSFRSQRKENFVGFTDFLCKNKEKSIW